MNWHPKSTLVQAAALLAACANASEAPVSGDWRWPDGCSQAGICPAYALQDECPNWSKAVELAEQKAGCSGKGRDDHKARACRNQFACDVCQFIEDQTWPPAYIRVVPGGRALLLGHIEAVSNLKDPYTPGSLHVAWVEFSRARCFGPGVGFWIFWEDNVEFLAKAMLHESLHLCKVVGGYGPSTVDPTTEDFVEACF
jgi:hypothetical protein